jgi:hypothetical protein
MQISIRASQHSARCKPILVAGADRWIMCAPHGRVQEHGRRPRDIKRDAGAAALILQEVLDSVRSGGASVGIGGAHR